MDARRGHYGSENPGTSPGTVCSMMLLLLGMFAACNGKGGLTTPPKDATDATADGGGAGGVSNVDEHIEPAAHDVVVPPAP